MCARNFFPKLEPFSPERCGVVLNSGEVKELKNHSLDPMQSFAMDDEELRDENIAATWHTHPRSGPNLSCADYHAFQAYPHLKHLIVSASEMWCYGMESDILVCYEDDTLTRVLAGATPWPDPSPC